MARLIDGVDDDDGRLGVGVAERAARQHRRVLQSRRHVALLHREGFRFLVIAQICRVLQLAKPST